MASVITIKASAEKNIQYAVGGMPEKAWLTAVPMIYPPSVTYRCLRWRRRHSRHLDRLKGLCMGEGGPPRYPIVVLFRQFSILP
jgi:hypothetical protein